MADNDEPQFTTLKERIAALNQQKTNPIAPASHKAKPPVPGPPKRAATDTTANGNGYTNGNGAVNKPNIPQVPQRPGAKAKAVPPLLPRRDTGTSQASSRADETPQEERKLPPQLPARTASSQSQSARPALPSRTSTASSLLDDRRTSVSSEASYRSTASGASQLRSKKSASHLSADVRRLPPQFDQASLPPLPPTRRELEAKAAQEEAARASRPLPTITKSEPPLVEAAKPTPAKPNLPPRLPSRTATSNGAATTTTTPQAQEPSAVKRPVVNGFGDKAKSTPTNGWKIGGFGSSASDPKSQLWDQAPPIPTRLEDLEPPPIPVTSRPSMAQIKAAKDRSEPGNASTSRDDCWICRDWSGPDEIAAQFPRETLPRRDTVGHLARGLCDPFPSYTDKARAIFTWFHHNIAYDTVSFFGKCITAKTPEETIFSGLAVCSGYAEVYKAIARKAGLECEVVVGHGKGYGYTKLKPGERPPPPNPDGHAWNAVRIDGGKWHLLDACWGAGHLDTTTNAYKKEFNPKQFIRSTEEFGESHFPKDARQQFRNDGRTIGWEEYFIGKGPEETVVFYTTAHGEGLLESSVEPRVRQISVYSGEVVRFQFSKLCEHWRSETHGPGKPPLLLLNIQGADGRKEDMVPIETDGFWHWADVNARDLGAPGQVVQVAQITTIEGKDARGVTAKEYFSKKGRCAMGWTYLLKWELV